MPTTKEFLDSLPKTVQIVNVEFGKTVALVAVDGPMKGKEMWRSNIVFTGPAVFEDIPQGLIDYIAYCMEHGFQNREGTYEESMPAV